MKIEQEHLDMWLELDQAITSLDTDWMYSDRTDEEQAKGREIEAQIQTLENELQALGWLTTPYVEIKMRIKKQLPLSEGQLRLLVHSPLSGHCEGWRKDA